MFAPSQSAGHRTGSNRPSGQPSKWESIKTFYTDPVKWNFVKSIGFFGVAVYLIRDLASNDLLPME